MNDITPALLYLERSIQKYYADEITQEELKKELLFIIDDVIMYDVVYTKLARVYQI